MRDHPEKAAGKKRGVDLILKYNKIVEDEELELSGLKFPAAEKFSIVVPMPFARFRREFFGADGYQPLNDQRTRLNAFDISILELIDGEKTLIEILSCIRNVQDTSITLEDDFHTAINKMLDGHLLRWTNIKKTNRSPVIECHEEPFKSLDRLSSPVNVLWEPTLHCNLQCSFCYNSSGPLSERGKERNFIAQQFVDSGVLQVTIIGGEPLMLPDFWHLVDLFERQKVGVDFVTNGWFLDEKCVESLCQTNICQLMISIDGDENIHDQIRGKKGSFERAIRGLSLLNSAGFEVTVAPCIQRKNIATLERLIDILVEAGAARIKVRPMISEGRATETFEDNGLTIKEIENYQPILFKKSEEYKGIVSIVHRMPATELGVCACDNNPFCPGVITRHKGTCGIARSMCYVRYDGGVSPNTNLREFVFGNMFKENFSQIWQDEARWLNVRPPNFAGLGNLNL